MSDGNGELFVGLITILFVGLKLTGVITWSWWWVLAPLWMGFAIVLLVAVIAVIYLSIKRLVK